MDNNLLKPKSVHFKIGDYLSKGFELFKKDMGTFIVAFIFAVLMSIVPIVGGFIAFGNFMKLARKINNGQPANATDIFNFDDFIVYLKLAGIVFLGIIVIEIPLIILSFFSSGQDAFGGSTGGMPIIYIGLLLLIFTGIIYIFLKAFYIIPLVVLENVKSIREAWKLSSVMTGENILTILGFTFLVGILASLGYVACGIGVFISAPLTYVIQYVAFEDAMQQIKVDELEEIGKTEY